MALAAGLVAASAAAQEGPVVLRYPIVATVPPDFDLRIERLLAEVRDTDARALILDIDAWIGDYEVVKTAVGLLVDSDVPVYALVSGVALDVGAMIALAADSIYMLPGSSIGGIPDDGSAMSQNPDSVRQRRSAMRVDFRVLADRRGVHRLLVESMVDPEVTIPRIVDADRVLTLTAQGAVQFELAAAEIPSADALLTRLAIEADLVTANADGVTGTTIEVQNNGWSDIRIYLWRGGTRRRLGLVSGLSNAEFFVGHAEIAGGAGIRLLADPVGSSSGGHSTELIRVSPGLVVQWLLQNNLAQSSLFVHR